MKIPRFEFGRILIPYQKAVLDAQKTYQKAISDANGDETKIAKAKVQYNAAIEKATKEYELAKSGGS
ncbi:MAG: hypothetical protein QXY22_01475 [Candidatus Nitrosotenuis sp.]